MDADGYRGKTCEDIGKRQLFIFKEGIFNLIVHYLEKYSSIVQQMAYGGMFASLKVQILKVHG